jgi:hypothetical protein
VFQQVYNSTAYHSSAERTIRAGKASFILGFIHPVQDVVSVHFPTTSLHPLIDCRIKNPIINGSNVMGAGAMNPLSEFI